MTTNCIKFESADIETAKGVGSISTLTFDIDIIVVDVLHVFHGEPTDIQPDTVGETILVIGVAGSVNGYLGLGVRVTDDAVKIGQAGSTGLENGI